MPRNSRAFLAAALATALAALVAGTALAQSKGKIVCWKDKAGKVIGCGDRIPPEYQDAATQELDKRGMTRRTTGTAAEEAKRAAEAEELAKRRDEEKRRLAEQSRRDTALLNTYFDEKEIDQRRDRELQVVDQQIGQIRSLHKNAAARHKDAMARAAAAEKARKPADALKDEAAQAQADITKLERNIAAKEKEKEDIRARYAQTKQRFVELKSAGPRPAAAPSKK